LLDDSYPVINNLFLNRKKRKALAFLNSLLGPYKYLCILYITSDIFLWHKRPLDDDTLHRKFSIFFKTIKKIHTKLLKIWPDYELESPVSLILGSSTFGFGELYMVDMLKMFKEYGLSESAEPVVDVLWRLSYPILPLIDPTYNNLDNKTLKDWRKVLTNRLESYEPKTDQLPFDE